MTSTDSVSNSFAIQLFEGERISLTPFNPDLDAAVESRWTHDPDTMRLLSTAPINPLSPGQIKKRYQEAEKNRASVFRFAIRPRGEERLIGFAQLDRIQWMHGAADLSIGIGESADRNRGFGTDALRLVLRYAFNELNLRRLSAPVASYNEGAVRFLERAGFEVEVRRRRAVHRDGRRWDGLILGLLKEDWTASLAAQEAR